MDTPTKRLAAIRRAADLDLDDKAELVPSHSNDTWYVSSPTVGAAALRVCRIGGPA